MRGAQGVPAWRRHRYSANLADLGVHRAIETSAQAMNPCSDKFEQRPVGEDHFPTKSGRSNERANGAFGCVL
jgi:hypothetical protein